MVNEYRCFLAINIEPHLLEKIGNIQEEFKKTNNNVKYVKKENLHFTLKFFGNINNKKINEIIEVTKKVLSRIDSETIDNNEIIDNSIGNTDTDKTSLAIEGIGTFPNENYMKVLWIGTEDNSFLANLQKELDSEFKKLGFKLDKNFKTHLTIGRIRNLKNKKEFKEKINELKDIKIGKMDINEVSLKMSELTPKGPIYSDIETFNI